MVTTETLEGEAVLTEEAARRFGWTQGIREGKLSQTQGFRETHGSNLYYVENRLGQGAIVSQADLKSTTNVRVQTSTIPQRPAQPTPAEIQAQASLLPELRERPITPAPQRLREIRQEEQLFTPATELDIASAEGFRIGKLAREQETLRQKERSIIQAAKLERELSIPVTPIPITERTKIAGEVFFGSLALFPATSTFFFGEIIKTGIKRPQEIPSFIFESGKGFGEVAAETPVFALGQLAIPEIGGRAFAIGKKISVRQAIPDIAKPIEIQKMSVPKPREVFPKTIEEQLLGTGKVEPFLREDATFGLRMKGLIEEKMPTQAQRIASEREAARVFSQAGIDIIRIETKQDMSSRIFRTETLNRKSVEPTRLPFQQERVPLSKRTFTLKDILGEQPRTPIQKQVSGNLQLLFKPSKIIQKRQEVLVKIPDFIFGQPKRKLVVKQRQRVQPIISIPRFMDIPKRRIGLQQRQILKITQRTAQRQRFADSLELKTLFKQRPRQFVLTLLFPTQKTKQAQSILQTFRQKQQLDIAFIQLPKISPALKLSPLVATLPKTRPLQLQIPKSANILRTDILLRFRGLSRRRRLEENLFIMKKPKKFKSRFIRPLPKYKPSLAGIELGTITRKVPRSFGAGAVGVRPIVVPISRHSIPQPRQSSGILAPAHRGKSRMQLLNEFAVYAGGRQRPTIPNPKVSFNFPKHLRKLRL